MSLSRARIAAVFAVATCAVVPATLAGGSQSATAAGGGASSVSSASSHRECFVRSKITVYDAQGKARGIDLDKKKMTPSPTVTEEPCSSSPHLPHRTSSMMRPASIPGYVRWINFSKKDPNKTLIDSNGRFDGQVTFASAGYPMAWSYRVSPKLTAISPGVAQVDVWRDGGNCYYQKNTMHISYFYHGSCRGHVKNKDYGLIGVMKFMVRLNTLAPARIDWAVGYRVS